MMSSWIAPILLGTTLLHGLACAHVRVLYQNDLTANSHSTSALLVYPTTGGPNEAPTRSPASLCSQYNERLLDVDEITQASGIQDQLNYLQYRGDLKKNTQIYVAPTDSNGKRALRFERENQKACRALTVGSAKVEDVKCSKNLPALCTNSAPPYTVSSSSPSSGSLVKVSSSSSSQKLSVTGYRDARSLRFLGLPFAEPPVGGLRFQAAQPLAKASAAKLSSKLSALEYGAPCIQTASVFGIPDSSVASEDCLTLNVFTPAIPGPNGSKKGNTRLLPVAFWIFGGAFQVGSSSVPDYDGGNIASRGDVVVITMNYRVGALGNMASESLAGSQGITDQIQALKWVQQYIHLFGGDPGRVTIFGESAGGQSVVALLSSSAAKGLFHRAISQSAPWVPFFDEQVYTEALYPALLDATNCTSGGLKCLQSLDATTFIAPPVTGKLSAAAQVALNEYAQLRPLNSATRPVFPVIGTGVIDGLFKDLIQDGKVPNANIPLMIGDVRDEGTLFVDSSPQLKAPVPAQNATLQMVLPSVVDNATIAAINSHPALFSLNQSNPDALRTLVSQVHGLFTWQCPLQQIMTEAYLHKTFTSIHSFRFDKGYFQEGVLPSACGPRAPSGAVSICHSEDVPVVFASSNVKGDPYDDSSNSLLFTQYVVDAWASFIRTGDPQPTSEYHRARGRGYEDTLKLASRTPWKPFTPTGGSSIQILDLPPRYSGVVYPEECKVFEQTGFSYDRVQ